MEVSADNVIIKNFILSPFQLHFIQVNPKQNAKNAHHSLNYLEN